MMAKEQGQYANDASSAFCVMRFGMVVVAVLVAVLVAAVVVAVIVVVVSYLPG